MKAIPNYRAADLKPYLNFFQSIGAPVECGLSQHRLPITMDYADDLYLPQFPTLAFLECMEKKQGIDELPLRALHDLQITDLNKYFVSKAHQSPTLLAALVHFNRLLRDTDKKQLKLLLCWVMRIPHIFHVHSSGCQVSARVNIVTSNYRTKIFPNV